MIKYLILLFSLVALSTQAQVTYDYALTYDSVSFTLTDAGRHITQSYPLNTAYVSKNKTSVYLFTNSNAIINRWDSAKNLIYLAPNGNVTSGYDSLDKHIFSTNSAFNCTAVNECIDSSVYATRSYVLSKQNHPLHLQGNNSSTLVSSSLINKSILFLSLDGILMNGTFSPKQFTFVSGTGTITFAGTIGSNTFIDINYQ